jgi:hypothetical protein
MTPLQYDVSNFITIVNKIVFLLSFLTLFFIVDLVTRWTSDVFEASGCSPRYYLLAHSPWWGGGVNAETQNCIVVQINIEICDRSLHSIETLIITTSINYSTTFTRLQKRFLSIYDPLTSFW